MVKKVILAVTNDISTDQRVNKVARTLHSMGFDVVITGVQRKNSQPFSPKYAGIRRMRLLFHKKFGFYAEYNLKLFFLLLFSRFDLVVSNDLDTLPAAHLAAWLRRKPLVYDSHEYFCGSPEIISRPLVFRFWKKLEQVLFPKQKHVITVNDSIAALYETEYGRKPLVIRNLPPYRTPGACLPADELSLPPHKDIILLQGSGINIDRGAEELVMAMHPDHGLKNVLLLIIGSGDVLPALKDLVREHKLGNRVVFMDKMPYDELYEYTRYASIGVSLDKDTNPNYRFSLPNKLFDYIMAGTPQLASALPEVAGIIKKYNTGVLSTSHQPAHIAECISEMLSKPDKLAAWETNCHLAAKELCWEKEETKLIEFYAPFCG
ncbi:MAG: glycosyltransferase [Bacteroidales bacterium]|nr:glycosyltransferase [Bacteroidales bacterium]